MLSVKPILLFLFLATALVYGDTFLNQWTYDDMPVVVNNPGSHSLAGFFEHKRPGRPMRELTYIPEYKLFGEKPAGYHVQQILWHTACGFLLFRIMLLLGAEPLAAVLGVLFFLLHPLQSESVANISHRKELLALFFALSSTIAYMRGIAARGGRRLLLLLLSALAFGLALLSNQTAVTLPFILIAYEYLFVPDEERLLLKRPRFLIVALLICGASAAYLFRGLFDSRELLTIYSKNNFIASQSRLPLYMADLKAFGFYLSKIILPLNLAPEYLVKFSESPFQWVSWLCLAVLSGVVASFFLLRKKNPLAAFGIAWFLIFYLPIANILPVAYMVADRYMYLCLPGVGLVLAGAMGAYRQKAVVCTVGAIIGLFAILTIVQNTYWRDEHSLWRHAARVNPGSTWAQESAALSYLLTGELDAAESHARSALELNRFNTQAYLTLAKILEGRGKLEEAINTYEMYISVGEMEYPDEVAAVRAYLPQLRLRLQQAGKRG